VDLVLAKHPAGPDPQATYNLVTTYPGACRNRHIEALWAQAGLPVYAYEFNDRNAPYYFPPMPNFTPFAAHTIDIQFLFPLWHGSILGVPGASQSPVLTSQESILSDQLVAAWTKFARIGIRTELAIRLGGGSSIRKAYLSTYRKTCPVCRPSPTRSSVPVTTAISGTKSSSTSKQTTVLVRAAQLSQAQWFGRRARPMPLGAE
jgi:hypothetical protein